MNYKKLKTSALIALGGFLVTAIPAISNNLVNVINNGVTFDWQTPVTLFIGALSTWVIASIRNFLKNK